MVRDPELREIGSCERMLENAGRRGLKLVIVLVFFHTLLLCVLFLGNCGTHVISEDETVDYSLAQFHKQNAIGKAYQSL